MHGTHDFLTTLALVLGVAAITTVIFQRLRQPVVFGYMIAGLIIGPHVPVPLVADEAVVHTLSELGIILLMFSLGLEFSVRRLARSGGSVVVVAALETSLMTWFGYLGGRMFGWSPLESVFAGAAMAISSTTIIVKAFADQRASGRFTELVLGILIVEDLIAIVLIALLTPASAGAGLPAGSLALTLVRLVGFLVALLAVGMLLVPPFVRFVVRLQRPETTLVACIGLCFATALLARSIGYSVALGGFLAGSLVSESGEGKIVSRLIEPVRDMFVAVFFVSVGMMIVPELVAKHWAQVLVFAALVMAGKLGAVSASAFLTGAGVRTAVQAGMSLAQVGEFSFIIAGVGLASGASSPALYPIMVAVSALTALATPWLIRAAGPFASMIDGRLPRALQTFVALYGSWIEGMQARPETSTDRERIRRILRALALDACVIAALCIGTPVAAGPLGEWLAARTGMPAARGHALTVLAAGMVAVPFLVGIVRSGRALGFALARRAFPDPEPGRLDPAAAPRRALVITLQLATVLVVGAPLVAATQPFLPAWAGPGLLAASLVVLGFVVWRSAADLQGHVRAAAEVIVNAIGRHSRLEDSSQGERSLERAHQLLPGLGEPFPVRIAEGSPAIGARLGDLALRGRTGATILAISRGEEVVLVPDGHEVLRAGDVVALAGTRTAIEAARRVLAGEAAR